MLMSYTYVGVAAVLAWWGYKRLTRPFAPKVFTTGNARVAEILSKCEKTVKRAYRPVPWIRTGLFQTIACATPQLYAPPKVTYTREILCLSDGGQIAIDWAQPRDSASLSASSPVVVVLHGLNGSSREPCVMSFCSSALQRGWRPVVMISRGLSGVALTTWRPYNAGWTGDVRETVAHVRGLYPAAPLLGVGFSLGGNVLARYVAEEGEQCPLRAASVVSPPVDLVKSGRMMQKGDRFVQMLGSGLLKGLQRYSRRHLAQIQQSPHLKEGTDISRSLSAKSLWEYDNLSTSRVFGFEGTEPYYSAMSCLPLLPSVRAPLLMVHARDDPVTGAIAEDVTRACGREGQRCAVALVEVPRGGHLGYLEGTSFPRTSWADKTVCDFLNSSLSA
eukprot:m51a1_g14022 hypothetical protein (389) ;mRNA; f:1111105-1112582